MRKKLEFLLSVIWEVVRGTAYTFYPLMVVALLIYLIVKGLK